MIVIYLQQRGDSVRFDTASMDSISCSCCELVIRNRILGLI